MLFAFLLHLGGQEGEREADRTPPRVRLKQVQAEGLSKGQPHPARRGGTEGAGTWGPGGGPRALSSDPSLSSCPVSLAWWGRSLGDTGRLAMRGGGGRGCCPQHSCAQSSLSLCLPTLGAARGTPVGYSYRTNLSQAQRSLLRPSLASVPLSGGSSLFPDTPHTPGFIGVKFRGNLHWHHPAGAYENT